MSTCGRSIGLCTAVHRPTTKAPTPGGARAWVDGGRCQRQRIDMTSPATMAPKPIAKL